MTCTVIDENGTGLEPVDVEEMGLSVDFASEIGEVEDFPDLGINAMTDEQGMEAEQFAIEFLKRVIRLRGVRIDRAKFLNAELHKRGIGTVEIDKAIAEGPAVAGISLVMLDDIAEHAIDFETAKSTALSFAAGLPGGFAMIGTVPADITQFYVHAFRVMQKIAYIYGWKSFLEDIDNVDDETLGMLATFLGVMMGVGGASVSISRFAVQVVSPAVNKKIASVALTKTAWYLPMKHVLRTIGIQVTKQSFAKTVSKIVPVVGGAVSGGLTFVTLSIQSKRLMKHLRELPPPDTDAEVYMAAVKSADEMAPNRSKAAVAALEAATEATGSWIASTSGTVGGGVATGAAAVSAGVASAAGTATRSFRSVDIDGDGIPDEPRALTKVKGIGGAIAGTAGSMGGSVTGFFKSKKGGQDLSDVSVVNGTDVAEE